MNGNLSLIIVVFNRVHLLRLCLLSVKRQTVQPFEVIISDDGSQQDIVAGIKDLLPELSFPIQYIRQEDKGFRLAKCRNNAVKQARGDYLVFIDQDILSTPGYLEVFAKKQKRRRFLTALPVLLNAGQTDQINEQAVRLGSYFNLITHKQMKRIHRQFFKDSFYYYQRKFLLWNDARPKVRGGVFGLFKEDLLKVDGFDENYRGWGNEDDDLGRRLYKAGIVGQTAFYNEFPVHLYHPPFRVGKQNVNAPYYQQRLAQIRDGQYKALRGLSRPLGEDKVEVKQLK